METILTRPAVKYYVPDESVHSSDWNGPENGDEVSVIISSSSGDSKPYKLAIIDAGTDDSISVDVLENVVFKCSDSKRFFVILIPSRSSEGRYDRLGLGFKTREDSTLFVEEVLKSCGSEDLRDFGPDVISEFPSTPLKVKRMSLRSSLESSDFASVSIRQMDEDGAEDTAVTVGDSSIRASVPDVLVSEDTVSALRAAVSPGPGIKLHEGESGDHEGGGKLEGGASEAGAAPHPDDGEQAEEGSEKSKAFERKHLDEDITMDVWRKHKKHVFVVSIAGKPIYSRYGDEQNLAPFMASLSAMASFIEDSHDVMHYFVAGGHQIIFLLRGPLILVSVCSTRETRADVVRELDYVHSQIVSVLTNSSIDRIFEQRPDFDLRGLLTGTDRLLDNLMHRMNYEPGFMFHALRPLVMPAADRRNIANALQRAACPQLLFALLVHGYNFIHLARPKKFLLDAKDIHLLMNFVNSSTSFRISTTWTPICLPTFDGRGFLHALISFLQNGACLILLSAHVDAFYKLNSCATDIIEHLTHTGALDAITRAVEATNSLRVNDIDTVKDANTSSSLLHFVYRSHSARQIALPSFEVPYNTAHEQKRLLRVYQRVRDAVLTGTTLHANVLQLPSTRTKTAPDSSASGELAHKVYLQVSDQEAVLAYLSKGDELYAAFNTFETKASCVFLANKILTWVSEKAEDLFVLDMPTW